MDNNDVIKKLKIALQLREEEIIKIFNAADWDMSKNQVHGILQKKDHKNYYDCNEQTLRKFLDGLITHKRGVKNAGPKLKTRKASLNKFDPNKTVDKEEE